MPLYEFRCKACGHEFEELVNSSDVGVLSCKQCGSEALRKMSSFSSSVAGGNPNESIDMSIGREADKRWQAYGDRQGKRRGDKPLQEVSLPKTQDGKYMPVMGLGSKNEREKRTEYSTALQEHRQERIKRGQPQFVGPGAEF